jgi:hypothetical protein
LTEGFDRSTDACSRCVIATGNEDGWFFVARQC